MGTVYQAGASIDERNKATGGQAGNQTGAELRTRPWYIHAKGWYILRAKRADVRAAIAKYLRRAIPNRKIGYDQSQRYTLYKQVKLKGFDPAQATIACECDCSTLVATCVQAAFYECGIDYMVPIDGFRTTNEVARLLETGEFILLTADKYCARKDGAYLKIGDLACTKTQGHTVGLVSDGANAHDDDMDPEEDDQPTLKRGSIGEAVKTCQRLLLAWEPSALQKYGADSEFGNETDVWVRNFQLDHALTANGIVDEKTWLKLSEYAVKGNGGDDDGVDEEEAPTTTPKPRRKVLSKGDQGEDVKEVQTKLLAWNPKALPKYKADGDFGIETRTWLKIFQDSRGLRVDGIVGVATWAALDSVKMEANV